MNTIPFLYINITALCCYVLILCAFLAAKKTAEISYFVMLLISLILWTGCSLIMRLRAPNGTEFWFYGSLLSLLTVPVLLYMFVDSFFGGKNRRMRIILTALTVLLLVLTSRGLFLRPPVVSLLPGHEMVFTYETDWAVAVPCVFGGGIVIMTILLMRKSVREKGIHAPGILPIIIGCVAVMAGNIMQLLPNNIFPWDTLSGIIFALLFTLALYSKRIFRIGLLISRSLLAIISIILCIIMSAGIINPLGTFLEEYFHARSDTAHVAAVIIFSFAFVLIYNTMKKLLDRIFIHEGQQEKFITQFSRHVSQTLDTKDIIMWLIRAITNELPVKNAYVCLGAGAGEFELKYSADDMETDAVRISDSSPIFDCFENGKSHFLLDDQRGTEMYNSLREREKGVFQALNTRCVAALRNGDEVSALVLIPAKIRGRRFSMPELSFVDTVISIASIALKNAALYERVFHEARVDSLTGVYNYKYFTEKIENDFDACKDDCLSLMYLDVDDFKLYNQLYGAVEGNHTLIQIAGIISDVVEGCGTVFRCSGKLFAVLLPSCDSSRAYIMAREIQSRAATINSSPQQKNMKSITVSAGISVSPQAAKSAKELEENADLALYNAKMAGKGKISVFRPYMPSSSKIAERVTDIIERHDNAGESSYEAYSKTILALTAAIDAKDHYTYNHSQNVARYASILASAIGLSDDQIRIVYEAALLHDIGKISISESILSKNGPLTDQEFSAMREHVNNSIDIIRHLPSMDYLIPAAVSHHERWDGKGYPRGVAGDEIPLLARCLAIVDAFDAMTSDRPYRKRLSVEAAVDQIEKNSGTQFDPELAQVFVELVRSEEVLVGADADMER